jgi:DNA repair protein RadC
MIILQDKAIEATGPEPVVSALQGWLDQLDDIERGKEHFFVLLLDARNRVKRVEVVSIGTLNASLVHPREVFVRAIREKASSILIAHNHPSGTCEPSEADLVTTRRLRDAGKLIGIELTDHVILAGSDHYSFLREGTLPFV